MSWNEMSFTLFYLHLILKFAIWSLSALCHLLVTSLAGNILHMLPEDAIRFCGIYPDYVINYHGVIVGMWLGYCRNFPLERIHATHVVCTVWSTEYLLIGVLPRLQWVWMLFWLSNIDPSIVAVTFIKLLIHRSFNSPVCSVLRGKYDWCQPVMRTHSLLWLSCRSNHKLYPVEQSGDLNLHHSGKGLSVHLPAVCK